MTRERAKLRTGVARGAGTAFMAVAFVWSCTARPAEHHKANLPADQALPVESVTTTAPSAVATPATSVPPSTNIEAGASSSALPGAVLAPKTKSKPSVGAAVPTARKCPKKKPGTRGAERCIETEFPDNPEEF